MIRKLVKDNVSQPVLQMLKRIKYRQQMLKDEFVSPEIEFEMLRVWLKPGDMVVDVGANVGHYTKRMSDVVGAKGRVYAFEPMPATFELLAANCIQFENKNVTLINAAVHCRNGLINFSLPDDGNPYRASIADKGLEVSCFRLDSLALPRISLIKIDVEGNEWNAICGMKEVIQAFHPILIIEGFDDQISNYLESIGYVANDFPNSPNRVFSVYPMLMK